MKKTFTLLASALLLLTACASPPAKNYRYDEQKQAADKAQDELSRETRKSY